MTDDATQPRVMVVDDDVDIRLLVGKWLEDAGHLSRTHETGTAALADDDESVAVACIDLGLGDMSGLDVLRHFRAERPATQLVVITADRDLEKAVEAMRAGALDYVPKPLTRERLLHAIDRGLARHRLEIGQRISLSDHADALAPIIGESAPMRRLREEILRVADSDITVCILGESGSGKELVARAIHESSKRAARPLVALNCASIPTDLQESELFGHERGAFTGATNARPGSLERAEGGTFFMDELGEMSASVQASLLRAIQEKTIRRVGGHEDLALDVRVVCATHRDLEAEVAAGRFRQDLYYRLMVYPLWVPSLRERTEDIPLLLKHFLDTLPTAGTRTVIGATQDALEALMLHAWPGNVRELMNVVHRAVLSCSGEEIGLADLPTEIRRLVVPSLPPRISMRPISSQPPAAVPYGEGDEVIPLKELERRAILHAMSVADGNVSKAAKMLGLGRATLYRRLASLEDEE